MNKNNQALPLPKFKNEEEERKFWAKHSFTDYANQFEPIELDLSALKPSTRSITIRLPESLLSALKILANKKDVPYQSLTKTFLADRIKQEFGTQSS